MQKDNNPRNRKLDFEQATKAKKTYLEDPKSTYQSIADEFGVSHTAIRDIIIGKTWKDIE